MNKIIIISGVMVLGILTLGILTLVVAQGIGEGDIITQGQLDSIDATNISLQCQLDDVGQSHTEEINGIWRYSRNVSCLSIQPIYDNDINIEAYLLVRESHFPYFFTSEYSQCVEENNNSFCNNFYRGVLQEQHQTKKDIIRNKIKHFQTDDGNSGDTDYEGDIEL